MASRKTRKDKKLWNKSLLAPKLTRRHDNYHANSFPFFYLIALLNLNQQKRIFKNVPASRNPKNTKIQILSKSFPQSNVALIDVPLQVLIKFWYQTCKKKLRNLIGQSEKFARCRDISKTRKKFLKVQFWSF